MFDYKELSLTPKEEQQKCVFSTIIGDSKLRWCRAHGCVERLERTGLRLNRAIECVMMRGGERPKYGHMEVTKGLRNRDEQEMCQSVSSRVILI